MGLITAMFLKKLNSVLKMYASAAQLLFTAISSAIFFAIAINGQTILALIFIFISIPNLYRALDDIFGANGNFIFFVGNQEN